MRAMPSRLRIAAVVFLVLVFAAACSSIETPPASPPSKKASTEPPRVRSEAGFTGLDAEYVAWLENASMLHNADLLAPLISGKGAQWRRPYAKPQPREAVKTAPVWFSSYPAATIAAPGQDFLEFYASSDLWEVFESMGVQALHTGPVKTSGGIEGRTRTPTVDGYFDRISYAISPNFGSKDQYKRMSAAAGAHRAVIAGDIVPGHTGKGYDFNLALFNYKNYPGVYDMVEIRKDDWDLLPKVEGRWDTANVPPKAVDELTAKEYLPGRLERVMYSVPGVETPLSGYDATAEITGVDGKVRRWVYLHYFKPGQPTMNWADPSYGANRIIAGDLVQTLHVLGARIVRLDANPFLGVEPEPGGTRAWSEGHPLSVVASDQIAFLVRKMGGFSFQELNLTLEAMREFTALGPDLSYDFISRPAVEDAALTGDASLLRLVLRLQDSFGIEPVTQVHDMQNHDEITYELVHFARHPDEFHEVGGETVSGKDLREKVIARMHETAVGAHAPYNHLSGNGLCTTFTGLLAARLGVQDPWNMTGEQKQAVKRGHLALAAFNAMQPGVFGVSGWDMVGALPLKADSIKDLLKDGDYRWINRGAYDLMGVNPEATASAEGVPRAVALYGPLPEQLKDPESFASQVAAMAGARNRVGLHLGERLAVPEPENNGVVVMVHQLPEASGYEITAVNFGKERAAETVNLSAIKGVHLGSVSGRRAVDLISGKEDAAVSAMGVLEFVLEPLQAKALVVE